MEPSARPSIESPDMLDQTPEIADGSPWDVVVIGAGPAGAMAAHELARRGVSVLLVDKAAFPREKVCGSCLNGSALATLRLVGLGELPRQLGAIPLTSFRLAFGSFEATLPLPDGMAISRGRFDAALVQAATTAGAAFQDRTSAEVGPVIASGRQVQLHHGAEVKAITARKVLVADGLAGRTLKSEPGFRSHTVRESRIGVSVILPSSAAFYDRGNVFMACGDSGYVGVVRLEDDRLNVAAALDPQRIGAAGIGAAVMRLLRDASWPPIPELHDVHWRGTPALTRNVSRIAFDRMLLLGDAAGYVEPFTGEGIAWALASGVAAGRLVGEGGDVEKKWSRRYREMLAQRKNECRRLTQMLRYPELLRAALVVLSLFPALANPLIRRLNASPP